MSNWVDVAAAADLADGALARIVVGEKGLLIARAGDEFLAADDRCPHMGAQLSRGRLDGSVVVCPRHGSRFDLSDGRVVRWTELSGIALRAASVLKPPRTLRTYPTRVENGRVLVDLESGS